MADRLASGDDGVTRCAWCGTDPLYVRYHDEEWGVPVGDDVRLFEKICLEGFQAGLAWITILRKRENFRGAFDGFQFGKIARYDQRRVASLLQNAGIVRHRGKIESVINNAARALELVEAYGSLAAYFWQFEPPRRYRGEQAETAESSKLSKDLKSRGWSFVGPTTAYAFMQAMGLVNDHIPRCFRRPAVESLRRNFTPQ